MTSTAKINVFESQIIIETYYRDVTHTGAFDALDKALGNLHNMTYKAQVVKTQRNSGNRSANLYLGDGRIVFIQILV